MRNKAAALEYHGRGWAVVPLRAKTKRPFTEDWQISQMTEADIHQSFDKDINIGVGLGEQSHNLVDSDLDHPMAVKMATAFLPETAAVFGRASKRSSHRLYITDEKFSFKRYAHGSGPDAINLIELRGTGHQTMMPNSIHTSGETVEWEVFGEPVKLENQLLLEAHNTLAAATLLAIHWPTEGRHFAALHLSGGLLRARWSVERVEHFIGAILEAACDEEAADRIRTIRDTAEKLERGEEFTGWPSLAEAIGANVVSSVRTWLGISGVLKAFTFTDQGNAERLVARHGDDIRYCHGWKKWLIWDGKRWVKDESEEIVRRAKDVVQAIYLEAASYSDSKMQSDCAKWAIRSGDSGKITAMVKLAQSEVPIATDELDSDPLLINCKNGTLDLRTGGLREPRREDYITKIACIEYRPAATAPTWDKFLTRIMDNDQEMIDYLQKAVGYSITGKTDEDCFFIPWGSGRNGKSTFLETIKTILGDYAASTGSQTFMEKRGGGIPSDLASIVGSRFVSAAETDAGQRLSESLIKQITGGDVVQARFMYSDFFSFTPTFKVWIATNHRPTINSNTEAIWSRVRLIPFTVTIPAEERNPKLREQLSKIEGEGIFSWMVRGCREWLEYGLTSPDQVVQANASYREEMDTIGEFLEECILEPEQSSLSSDLYKAYQKWIRNLDGEVLTPKVFKQELETRGFQCTRRSAGIVWLGIGTTFVKLVDEEINPFGTP